MYSDVLAFICDIINLYLLSFFVTLVGSIPILLYFQRTTVHFHWLSLLILFQFPWFLPWFLLFTFQFYLVQNMIFTWPLRILYWHMCYLKLWCLISSYLFLIDSQFHFIVVWQNTWYDLSIRNKSGLRYGDI